LPTTQTDLILARDFNCVLSQADTTGHKNYSRALETSVNGLGLTDACDANAKQRIYTHYTPTGASLLDRIYISRNLQPKKKGVETIVAAFTDHLAVVIRMAIENSIPTHGRGYWKMNASLLRPTFDKFYKNTGTDGWHI
jgi:endonuclease/exonuclease/phosphatase family metal-dependent hydrolase